MMSAPGEEDEDEKVGEEAEEAADYGEARLLLQRVGTVHAATAFRFVGR